MSKVPLISLLCECKRRGICFGPTKKPQIMIYYWFYDKIDKDKNLIKRGDEKGYEERSVDKIDLPHIRRSVEYFGGSHRWLKRVNDPKIADVIVKTPDGKEFYYWQDIWDKKYKRVPTNPSWIKTMPQETQYMKEMRRQIFEDRYYN